MHELPKTHKSSYPLQPVISSIRSYNHEVAKYLSDMIKSNMKEKEKSFPFVRNSFDFVKKIIEIKRVNDHTMLSFDVDNLFTNVPVNETIEVTLNKIYKKNQQSNTSLKGEEMKHLLETAVKCPIQIREQNFLPDRRSSDRILLEPFLADFLMTKLERKLNRLSSNSSLV